ERRALATAAFGILGPVVARTDGREVHLGGKPRAALAALLLHANTVVSRDRLIAALWEEPPASAVANVQTHINQLRRALPGARLPPPPRGPGPPPGGRPGRGRPPPLGGRARVAPPPPPPRRGRRPAGAGAGAVARAARRRRPVRPRHDRPARGTGRTAGRGAL